MLNTPFVLGQSTSSPQAMFDEANTHFENRDFDEAMKSYRTIIDSNHVSGALFLNMGITAIQMDSMGLGKYYFLKAQSFETTRQQAQNGLEYVNDQFSRQSAILPKLPWDRAIEWINKVPGSSGLFLIGFCITMGALLLLYASWLGKLNVNDFFAYIIGLLILGTAVVGLAFYADYVDQRYDEAVLITTSSRVLETPETNATLVSIGYEGYDLTVDHWKSEEKENWLYVRLGNGQYGWILQEGVKIL